MSDESDKPLDKLRARFEAAFNNFARLQVERDTATKRASELQARCAALKAEFATLRDELKLRTDAKKK